MSSVRNYYLPIETLRDVAKKNRVKIIFKIKFSDFPNLETAILQLYPGKSKTHDGTDETMIPVSPTGSSISLTSNTFVLANSHFDIKKLFREIIGDDDTGYFIFTPTISQSNSDYPDHLVFDVKLQLTAQIAVIDLGQSNPCPPAPPGIANISPLKKKKGKKKDKKKKKKKGKKKGKKK